MTPHKLGKSVGRVAAANKNLLSTDVSLKNFTRDPSMTENGVTKTDAGSACAMAHACNAHAHSEHRARISALPRVLKRGVFSST